MDKPAGLPIHPTARYHHGTLTSLLRERYGEGFGAGSTMGVVGTWSTETALEVWTTESVWSVAGSDVEMVTSLSCDG